MATSIQLRPLLLGTVVALAALVLATVAAGPALRALVGPPTGFDSDYTSTAAYVQAGVAQCISLAVAFFLFGIAARNAGTKGGWRWALWVANPISVGVAYWVFRLSRSGGWPYEYTAYHGWLVLMLVAPLLFAPCVHFGSHLLRKHQ